ncbi:MAG: rod shape-determining protein MreD [Clostridia bacterium]|nr:rod shape-determining protein MreD [Clostridia bacterium]
MTRRLTLGGLLLLALLLETTVLDYFSIRKVEPDIVLLLGVFFALFNGPAKGALFGFIGGLAQDLLVGQFIGINALTKMVTCYLMGKVEQRVYKDHVLVPAGFLFLASIINEVLFYLIGRMAGLSIEWTGAFNRVILPLAIYNAVLAPLFYNLFYRSHTRGWLKKQEY